MAMERRLGKGLGSLLGEPERRDGFLELDLEQLQPNPFQPRESMDPGGLEELRASIQNHGVLQPVVVRRVDKDYQLISGERRWRAARLAGLERIPAVLRDDVSDDEMLELALVENVQRRDLDPMERARGYRAMMDSLGLTQEGVAAKVGLKRSTVANHVRLLDLPDEVQQAVARGLVSMGHARALLGLAGGKAIVGLLEETIRSELSVRDVERRVREALSRRSQSAGSTDEEALSDEKNDRNTPAWARELETRMRENLGTKVSILPGEGAKGRIVIEYFSRESLDRLCELLAPRPRV